MGRQGHTIASPTPLPQTSTLITLTRITTPYLPLHHLPQPPQLLHRLRVSISFDIVAKIESNEAALGEGVLHRIQLIQRHRELCNCALGGQLLEFRGLFRNHVLRKER